MTDPECIQMDEFKNEQLLSLTINLLLFIRSQVPVTKKLFQSCESDKSLILILPQATSNVCFHHFRDVIGLKQYYTAMNCCFAFLS